MVIMIRSGLSQLWAPKLYVLFRDMTPILSASAPVPKETCQYKYQVVLFNDTHMPNIYASLDVSELNPNLRKTVFYRPEVRKLLLFYVFTFSRPEVRKLLLFYVITYYIKLEHYSALFHFFSTWSWKTIPYFDGVVQDCSDSSELLIHWSYCSIALRLRNME